MKEYIGDGVYALFDGYGIELRANDAEKPTDIVYLEPDVLTSFLMFVEQVKKVRPVKSKSQPTEVCHVN
jgi:hypothetical protein